MLVESDQEQKQMYKKILRIYRQVLIKLLFRLLHVESKMKKIILYEDLNRLEENETSVQIRKDLAFQYNRALAAAYMNPFYREYLYFVLAQIEREHVKTLDPLKKDTQIGSILFILKHLDEMKSAYQNLTKTNALNKDKLLRILRSHFGRRKTNS